MSPYEKALAINPDNKELLLKLGNIYKNEKNLSKSGEYYQKAIALDDKYTDAWFNLGLVYANTNKLNDAIDCFNKVIAIDSKYTTLITHWVLPMSTSITIQERLKTTKNM